MALSNDQKAILRVLAQRGAAGYDDLTALIGIDAAEVHERAKAAAAQLESEGIPAPSIPPPGAAAAESPAASEAIPPPPEAAPAAPPEPEKPAPSPAAEAPATAPAATPEPTPRSGPPKSSGSRPKVALPSGGGGRVALAAGAAIVVALIVVILVSGGGGDSGSGDTTTTPTGESTTASEETGDVAKTNPKLTQAVLGPVDGGDAKGLATFGRVKKSLALQLEAEGLEPTGKGQSYTIWLYESARKRLPLASTAVGDNGKIGAQVEVPTEVLAYLANETFDQLYISLTDDASLKAALTKATKEKKAPTYTGTDVLSGTITGPIIGAAKKK